MEEKIKFEINLTRKKLHIGIVLVGMALGIYLNWNIAEVIFFGIFIWSILEYVPSRILAIPAIFFLAIAPFLLILDRKERAEEFAIYAYYFLVMAVLAGIYEIRKEGREKSDKSL